MMRKYNREKAIVYNTAQMYRWDRIAYLKELKTLAENEVLKLVSVILISYLHFIDRTIIIINFDALRNMTKSKLILFLNIFEML